MNVEESRLRTFQNWPANGKVDPQRIARAGFYYTGREFEVQCFCCGCRIEEWDYGDQAMVRHRRLSPDCPFVIDPSSADNVPLCATAQERASESTSNSSRSPERSTSPPSPTGLSSSSGSSSENVNSNPSGPEDVLRFRSEATRLESFEHWPIPEIVAPARLAQVGFYYQGNGDQVTCAFCGIVLGLWEAGDQPEIEHRRHCPTCPFLYNVPVGNIPIANDLEDPCSRLAVRDLRTENYDEKEAMKELGIQSHHGPQNPKYATLESRLRTYTNWPSTVSQKPEDLAAAGFYYSGSGDQVKCFYCTGGLLRWDPSDDPWIEHARWFSTCGFVTLVKGEQFVKDAIAQHSTGTRNSSELDSAAHSTTPGRIKALKLPVRERQVSELMRSEPVVAALSTGLDVLLIKKALRKKLEDTGVPYATPDDLIEAALDVEDDDDDGDADINEESRLSRPSSSHRSGQWRHSEHADLEADEDNLWETETEEEEGERDAVEDRNEEEENDDDHDQTPLQRLLLRVMGKVSQSGQSELSNDEVGTSPEATREHQEESSGAVDRNSPLPGTLQGATSSTMSQSLPSLSPEGISDCGNSNKGAADTCRKSLPHLPAAETANSFGDKKGGLSLAEENRRLKEARQCKICMDSEACVVFLPCGHLVTCVNCAPSLSDCPICRQPIKATVRTFLS